MMNNGNEVELHELASHCIGCSDVSTMERDILGVSDIKLYQTEHRLGITCTVPFIMSSIHVYTSVIPLCIHFISLHY